MSWSQDDPTRPGDTQNHGATGHDKVEKKDTEQTHILNTGQEIDKSTEKALSKSRIEQTCSQELREVDTQNTRATRLDMGNNKDKSNPPKEDTTNSKGADKRESQTYNKEAEKHATEITLAEELSKDDQSRKMDMAKKGNNVKEQASPEDNLEKTASRELQKVNVNLSGDTLPGENTTLEEVRNKSIGAKKEETQTNVDKKSSLPGQDIVKKEEHMGQNKPGQGCDENHGADEGRQQESGQFGLQVPISTDKIGDDSGPTNVLDQSPDENDFMVKKVGNFVIITHLKSQSKKKMGCKGELTFERNTLFCNDECYEVKYENNKIILMPIGEVTVEQTPDGQFNTAGAKDHKQSEHQPTNGASKPTNSQSLLAQTGVQFNVFIK